MSRTKIRNSETLLTDTLSKAKEGLKSILSRSINIKCKTENQKNYLKLIKEYEIVVCSGPPGVGKSYISIAAALKLVQSPDNSYEKLLIIKPAISVEENLGFLPGDLQEKIAPYMAPSIDFIDKVVGPKKRAELEESGDLILQPLGFIRGKTIDKSIVIIEEAQNISPSQMKSLLTRIGYKSKFIISGDLGQSDKYRDRKKSGLYDIMERHTNIKEMGFFEFNNKDVVRNPIIAKILLNYEDEDE